MLKADTAGHDTIIIAGNRLLHERMLWKNKGAITVRINQDVDTLHRGVSGELKNNILLRSVKLFVSHSKDSLISDTAVTDMIVKPDTSSFKLQYSKKLQNAGMKFNIKFKPDNRTWRKTGIMYIDPPTPFHMPGVLIGNFSDYIFERILPQIILGVILALITALAFILSFRNLSEHMTLNELKSEFIGNMTHELRTPVATISVALEALGKYNMIEERQKAGEFISLAEQETRRLEALISRVLEHSVLEKGRQQIQPEPVNMNALITETVSIMSQKIEEGSISTDLDPGLPEVICDRLLVKGLMINLIDNAIKYCDKTPEVLIRSSHGRTFVTVEVEDNGPGIPHEYQKKIFEKFFRLPASDVHTVKGYGLGLSFAKLIMNLHRGRIDVKNNDTGCTFTLRFPFNDE